VNENNELVEEINTQSSLLKQLKQTILQEAIEGKLTEKRRAKNPDIGTAKELLAQIKIEKEKLIKEKKLKPSKPLAPINEDEIPFDIPQNWEWCRLGDVITNIKGGGTPSKANSKFWNGNIPWASVKDLKNDFIDFTDDFITEEALNNSSTNLIPKGNIIISTRMGLGKIAFNNIDTCINQDLKAIFLNNINSKYFFSVYKTYSIVGRGMTVDGIRQEDLLSYMFPLPPLEEQKEIVATIEKLFTLCDELESEINQNKTTVQTIMATVLKEAFEQQ
jgi:type I restriction enzyme S subunit